MHPCTALILCTETLWYRWVESALDLHAEFLITGVVSSLKFWFLQSQPQIWSQMMHTADKNVLLYIKNICLYSVCTKIKANLLQLQLSSWLRGVVASTVRREKKSSDCSTAACVLTFKHSTLTMQPVHYHYKKNNQSNIWKKTMLGLNM